MIDFSVIKNNLDLDELSEKMRRLEQVECKETHNFSDGVYVRELFIPKGTIILGKRHRYETCNILLSGSLQLYMGKGVGDKQINAPLLFNSNPGVRKLAYALEDTVFLNIHPTNETDLEKIEKEFIISEKEFLSTKEANKCLG